MALTKTDVSALYVAIFNRASEGEGNTFWQTAGTSAEVANAMLETAPAKEYFGAALDDDQAFVEHIYLNTLGKTLADDAEGIEFWVEQLATQSRGDVIARLIESALDEAHEGTDAQNLFLNMVAVSDYTADTLEEAPDDLDALRFDAGLEGVTADEASVEAAKKAVDQVLNPVDPVTQALNELEAAKKELADFNAAAAKNELVIELGGDVSELQAAAVVALATDAGIQAGDSPAVIQAKIGDTVTKLNNELAAKQKAFNEASAEVAKVAGLPAALLQLAARAEAAENAGEALLQANTNYRAELAKFEELNPGVEADDVIDDTAAPKLNAGVTEAKYPGVTELLGAAQAQFVAVAANTNASTALVQANAAVLYLDAQPGAKNDIAAAIADIEGLVDTPAGEGEEAGTERADFLAAADKLTQKQVQDALNKALNDGNEEGYDALVAEVTAFETAGLPGAGAAQYGETSRDAMDAQEEVADAEEAIKDFNEKLADLAEATELQSELKAKTDAVDAAVDAFEELGVEAPQSVNGTVIATVDNDLFLSDTAGTILYFGQQGEDRLFVGEADELVVLTTQNINNQSVGSSSTLEVFAQQTATGVDLWVEKQAFAGNASSTSDLVKITLSGVTADDLVLEDGFLSIA